MSIIRKRALASLAIIVAIAVTPVLSGCSVQSIIENATGGQVDIGGTSVPKDFPSEVPLIDGEVIFGGSLGSENDQIWNVTIKVGDSSAFEAIKTQLTDAGFTAQVAGSGEVQSGAGGTFENDKYGLLVVVSDSGDDGFIANYTVTTKTP